MGAVQKNRSRLQNLTIHQFYCEIAKLGGLPHSSTRWRSGMGDDLRGGEKLNSHVEAAELAINLEKCGE